jgi:hypothetical protein
MKQKSRAYKSYQGWRPREYRMFFWALAAGGAASAAVGVVIWLVSRHSLH